MESIGLLSSISTIKFFLQKRNYNAAFQLLEKLSGDLKVETDRSNQEKMSMQRLLKAKYEEINFLRTEQTNQ